METMLEVLNASSGQSSATSDKFVNHVITGRFASGFLNTLMAKDVRLYLEAVDAPARIDAALASGAITAAQAEQFRQHGALGSHLELLQRDQGYKGFNQTGISEIIQATDPRKVNHD